MGPCCYRRTVLVLLEDDIRPTFKQRVMQWLHTKLVAQAQQSWAREALRAVPASLRNAGTSSLATPGIPIAQEPWEIVFDQMLPSNLCIGPSLCATKILLDKPIINAGAAASITSSAPRPVRRFSSIGGGGGDQPHNLTINTITLTPSRTIGLEVATAKDREEARCQLFSKEGVVFASDRHVLIQALGSTTSTPPTSRDAAGRRRSSMLSTETSSQWLKMVFSITMQHHHVRNSREHSTAAAVANFQPYYSLLSMLSKLLDNFDSKERQCSPQDVTADIRPVLLHRSDRVVEYGRARAREEHDISGDQVLQLEISASTASLQASDPIQILVKVITQPMQQDAFGNTEMIRKGEIVLMEGLDMARQMAQAAGWTCLAEDDSHMVEWVRDQMSIQWSSEATSTPLMLLPVSSTLKGLDTFVRSRTTSNGSTRVRTPSLSPYASRTHSYRKLRAEVGEDEKRDSTLARLQEATENLQAHEKEAKEAEEHLTLPNVTIAAAEGSSAGRPGLKTSFGGFSSLSDTRIQTLALAEETEDHLGMALSISPLGGTTSLKERSTIEPSHGGGSGNGAFSEGIGPLDESKPVSPKPRMLSRFSIKSYQLERNNHGLSDEWLIGGGLNTTLGGTQSASTASSGDDFVSTPPLVADNGLSGNVSPLTPSPEALPTTDFLQNLGAPGHRSKLFDRSGHHDQQQALSGNLGKSKHLFDGGIGSGASDDLLSDSLDNSNLVDNGSRKNLTRFGGVSVIGKGGANHAHSNVLNPSPLDAPVELVHDFLGESFSTPPKSLFSRPLLRMDLKTGWDRAQSAPAVPVASSLPMTTKMVHFADSDSLQQQLQQQSKDVLQRVHSEPAVMTTAPLLSQCEPSSLFGDATTRRPSLTAQSSSSSSNSSLSSLSSMSSMSKSKAHTRRSWGQGIGGNDILGIQGLS
ncbi:hypothetical protein EDD11_004677 [Mortierella claussenii]|nr:hypothetical protein EDD11_004677 [Mortierella claussenii]